MVDAIDFNATTRASGTSPTPSRPRCSGRSAATGRASAYPPRRFAARKGQNAGDFSTPREDGLPIARLIEPEPGARVDDSGAGSAGPPDRLHPRPIEVRNGVENALPREAGEELGGGGPQTGPGLGQARPREAGGSR